MRTTRFAIAAGFALAVCAPVLAQNQDQDQGQSEPQAQAPVTEAAPAQPQEPAPVQPPAQAPVQAQEPAQPPAPPQDLAKDVVPPTAPSRYAFNRVDGGFLRLDSVSGQVALCSRHAAGWVCEVVPEDRTALEKEIARLQDAVADMKTEIASLRAPPPPPRPPAELTPPAEKKDGAETVEPKITMPTREDVERARAAIEKAWRRLVDMIVGFQKDMLRKG